MNIPTTRTLSVSIGFREFVILAAAMMSCQALAVDAMLPALSTIARELGVTEANRTQWVVTVYVAGLGIGQLFWGMLSDRFGRRPILLTGLALYVGASLLAGMSDDFVTLLAWRFVHGIAGACMVLSRSMIRDLYEGRQMARVMSLTFIVFIMVPVIAPSLGQLVMMLAPWRALFTVFGVFGAVVMAWVWWRLPETLHPEYRLTLTWEHVSGSFARVLSERASLWYTLAVAAMFGSIIAYVGMVEQIFADVFHRPALMPSMFALCAATMGVSSFLNSRIVERLGMRVISQTGLFIFIGFAALHTLVAVLGYEQLWTFVLLQALTMSCMGLIAANFGAMAMESMGSIAGIAASLQGCIGTAGGALIGTLVGRQFDGSTVPLAAGATLCGLMALACVLVAERGKLFRPHH